MLQLASQKKIFASHFLPARLTLPVRRRENQSCIWIAYICIISLLHQLTMRYFLFFPQTWHFWRMASKNRCFDSSGSPRIGEMSASSFRFLPPPSKSASLLQPWQLSRAPFLHFWLAVPFHVTPLFFLNLLVGC